MAAIRVWFALLVCPLLALGDQSASFATVGWSCAHQLPVAVHAMHFLFLLATAAGTVAAWQTWLVTRRARVRDDALVRRHFLAGLATASAAVSVLAIVAMWIPTWVIAACI